VAKNIVLCCDGTANEFGWHNTNVIKLYWTLVHNQVKQCTYYQAGIGTMEPPGALTPISRRLTRTLSMTFGAYLEYDIRSLYSYLMERYEPGDRVFMFGFSRGAYTVRTVAALLRMYGLLRPGNESLIPYAIRMMMAISRDAHRNRYPGTISRYFELAASFKSVMARECKPHFIGVWDTVSSVGWIASPIKLPYVSNNADIAIARHAVALDERRAFFRTNLWRPGSDPNESRGPLDLKQVWFAGVHGDVGGGYPEAESGLSKLALEWMLDEAEAHGLIVNQPKRAEILSGAPPDPHGPIHKSLSGPWNVAEFLPRRQFDFATKRERWRTNRYRRRTVPQHALIHWSVYDRGPAYVATLNLPPTAVMVPKSNRET
jgi:uncharacterized protein (DUF2235 family)